MNLKIVRLSVFIYLIVFTSCNQVITTPVEPAPTSTSLGVHKVSTEIIQSDSSFVSPLPSSPTSEERQEELIVFSGRDKHTTSLGLINSDGQNTRYLTDTPGNNLLPKWSPNGQYIAYLLDHQIPLDEYGQQFYDLWVYDFSAQQSTPLTQEGRVTNYLTGFSWAPNSDKIIYVASRAGTEVVHLKDLSIDPLGFYLGAPFAWSKRSEIAIRDTFIEPMASFSLAILDSTYNPVIPPADGFRVGAPYNINTATSLAWHPEGEQLAIGTRFTAKGDSDLRIVSISEDTIVVQASLAEKFGDQEFRFSFPPPSEVTDVVWSPDGNMLAFRFIQESNEQIYVTNSALTEMRALTPADKLCNYPQWSPDSTRLVFSCRGQAENDNKDIWVVNADGSDLHPLTKTSDISEETPMWQPQF